MQPRHLFMLASLLAAPVALGHAPDGTPKNYCEDLSEWEVHDYAPPADGRYVSPAADGNILGDCNFNGIPGDYDFHKEWAMGGAWLSAYSWESSSMSGQWGGGSVYCHGEFAHHPVAPVVAAVDVVLGPNVFFRVSADHLDIVGVDVPSCGDFEAETAIDCFAVCAVPFPPGLDGAYQVCVQGTQGHVLTGGWWGTGPTGPALQPGAGVGKWCGNVADDVPDPNDIIPVIDYPQCMDGSDNDNDGSVDWVNDADCNSPIDDTEQS